MIEVAKNDFSDVKTDWAFRVLSELYGEELAAAQLALEHESHEIGEAKFKKALDRQMKRGETSETSVAKPLVAMLVPKFVEKMDAWVEHQMKNVRRKSVALKFIQMVATERVAVITIKTVINAMSQGDVVLQAIAGRIGRGIEEEARFGRIRDQEAKHFKKYIREALNKRNGHTYKRAYMHAVEDRMLEAGNSTVHGRTGTTKTQRSSPTSVSAASRRSLSPLGWSALLAAALATSRRTAMSSNWSRNGSRC
ncbi:hypothetical protein RPN53_00035 [Pseudomonas putida]